MDFTPPAGRADEPGFKEVAAVLLANALSVCQDLLPGGQRRGHEYVCGDLSGGKGESLSVNLRTGVWKDFATGVGGADLVNLWAAAKHLRPIEAKREAAERFGVTVAPPPRARSGRAEPIYVAKDGVPGDRHDWWRGQKAERIWDYLDADGRLFAQVYRWRHPTTGEKVVRPWDPETRTYAAPDGKRPLYNLPGIVETRGLVIAVEGEKCADALREDGWVATTVMGGAQAIGTTDWAPLRGRDVLLWRDNDRAGQVWQEKAVEALRTAEAASVRVVPVPRDRPEKWDAADATVEERIALIESGQRSRPVITGRPILTLTDWAADGRVFAGKAPDRQWLVREVFPLGAPSLLAAMGDTGKGMMLLDLALRVATDRPNPLGPVAFGCTVSAFGRAVILAAEDDRAEMHRRLERLDPQNKRAEAGDRLIAVPLPNAGGAPPLIRATSQGIETTNEFDRLRDQLLALDDLRLIVVDPLASFVQGDINRDGAVASFIGQKFAMLASETGAAVILAHHMRKPQGGRAITGPEDAREAIRGQAALIDGLRAAYALWPAERVKGKAVCRRIGIEYDRRAVVHGAVVKANGPSDSTVRTYVRDRHSGLLVDRTPVLVGLDIADVREVEDQLVAAIRKAANEGKPYYLTSKTKGLHALRETLPPALRELGREKLEATAKILIQKGRIVQAKPTGAGVPVLDVPGGGFAQGMGRLERGALETVEPGEGVDDD